MTDTLEPKSGEAAEEAAPGAADAIRPRRAYLPAKERRRRIIEAAQAVFARSNLQGARTRDIAKAAEINQATLFEHFESKDALFHAAVVEPLLEAMRGMQDRAHSYEAAGSLEAMQALAQVSTQRHLDLMVEIFPLFTAALFSDLELGRTLYREQIAPLLKERSAAIAGLVKDGMDAQFVELAIFGMFMAVAMDRTLSGDGESPHNAAEQLTRLASTGFLKRSE